MVLSLVLGYMDSLGDGIEPITAATSSQLKIMAIILPGFQSECG